MNEIERAIQEFEDNAYHTSMKPTISEASKAVALRILRAELSRHENSPLTWDELKAMQGKAVYIKMLVDDPKYPSCWSIIGESFMVGETEHVEITDAHESESGSVEKYGKTWIAYRYEPKGEKE